jgi:hypothetical protein
VRDGFRMILDAQEDIEVVGEAADGLEAIAKAHELGAVALPPKDDSRRELLSGADHRGGLEIVENTSHELFVRPLPDERRIKDSFELGRERSRFVASWEFRFLADGGEPAGDLRSPLGVLGSKFREAPQDSDQHFPARNGFDGGGDSFHVVYKDADCVAPQLGEAERL